MAISTNTTTLSRRRALVGLASAAAAIPLAAHGAAAGLHPDAALLDLGKTLARLIDEYHELQERHLDIETAWVPPEKPDVLRVTGRDFICIAGSPIPGPGEVLWLRQEIVDSLAQAQDTPTAYARLRGLQKVSTDYNAAFLASRRDCGADAAAAALEDAGIRIDAVTDQMRAMRATTLEGFAAKALAITFHAPHLWDEKEDDMDWNELVVRNLVDEALTHLPEAIAA